MIAAGLVAFAMGVFLAQFNVFSLAIATVVSAALIFIIAMSSGWTVFDSALVSTIAVLALQAGYVGHQLLRISRK